MVQYHQHKAMWCNKSSYVFCSFLLIFHEILSLSSESNSENELWINNTNMISNTTRQAKLFFLYPLFLPFRPRACLAGTALSQRGVCYTPYQCSIRNGVSSGACASGRGVCCVFQYSCGGSSSGQNYTYFTNPNYPSSYSGGDTCSITVTKANYSVCQIRINLLTFSLAPPTALGVCSDDFMYTSAASTIRLCGENSGQHLYVDFNTSSSLTITVDTSSTVTFSRYWYLEIVQIPCSSDVPPGCLQYFNTTSGTVSSFNYASSVSTATNTDGSVGNRQIAGLHYGVCIKPVSGYCSVEWAQDSSSLYTFTVSADTADLDTTVLGNSTAAVVGSNCTTNFVVIPDAYQSSVAVAYDRFCGNALITTTSPAKPYVLYVVTAAASTTYTATDIGNRGFQLDFRLLSC